MKIYAENRAVDLVKLVNRKYVGRADDTIKTLQVYGRFHALAIYYNNNNQTDKALQIWSR